MDIDITEPNVLSKLNNSGLSGIINLGNTCFLNSAIQILSNVRIFTLYFLSDQYNEDINENKKEVKFLNEYVKLIKAMWEDNCVVKPVSFKRCIGHFCREFSGYNQNDSQEALHKILDLLHESLCYEVDINIIRTNPHKKLTEKDKISIEAIESWRKEFNKHYSIPVNLFYGQFYSRLQCQECNSMSRKFDSFNVFELNITNSCNNIYDCLENYILSENIDGDNAVFCDKCKKKTNRMKKISVWKAPDILIFSFSRFRNPVMKINKRVDFPLKNLCLGNVCEKNEDRNAKYDLIGVSNHKGGMMGGHYTSYCKNGNGSWYHFNDSNVDEIDDPNQVISNEAYVIVYERKKIDIQKIIN